MFIIKAENTTRRKIEEVITLNLETAKEVREAMRWLPDSCNKIRITDNETGEIIQDYYVSPDWHEKTREIWETLTVLAVRLREIGE
jgi:hypothetical protein